MELLPHTALPPVLHHRLCDGIFHQCFFHCLIIVGLVFHSLLFSTPFCFPLHPSPNNPQKKYQNHYLGDLKIYEVDDVGYPKKQMAKFLQGTFFNKISLKTL